MDRQELLDLLHQGECNVSFIKTDGSVRNMRCTLKSEIVSEHVGPGAGGSSSPKVIPVVDLDISEWRCFKPETVLTCELLDETEEDA